MQFPITIGLHRSRILLGALAVTSVLAIGMVMLLWWSISLKISACLLVAIVAHMALRRLRIIPSAIRLQESGTIQLIPAGEDQFVNARLLPGATVHPWLTIARLKTEDGRIKVLIVAVDSLKPADFRRLRTCLRWRNEVSVEEGDVP